MSRVRAIPLSGTSNRKTLMADRYGHVDESDQEVGQKLADNQFRGLDRSGDQLLHGPPLPLPGNGERGQERCDHGHDHGDQAGNDEVPGFEVGIVPDPAACFDEGHDPYSRWAAEYCSVMAPR